MGARNRILNRLRQAQPPFDALAPITERRHVVPLQPLTLDERVAQFVSEAEKLGCRVYRLDRSAAVEQIMDLLAGDRAVLSWAEAHIPLAGLHAALEDLGVAVGRHNDSGIRAGITGATAALAATGSIVVESGAGRFRSTSLLPDLHIALITPQQILPDLESWQQAQQEQGHPAFTKSSNTTIISGPSKTADIAQQLIKGAHGPREVHILILPDG